MHRTALQEAIGMHEDHQLHELTTTDSLTVWYDLIALRQLYGVVLYIASLCFLVNNEVCCNWVLRRFNVKSVALSEPMQEIHSMT